MDVISQLRILSSYNKLLAIWTSVVDTIIISYCFKYSLLGVFHRDCLICHQKHKSVTLFINLID